MGGVLISLLIGLSSSFASHVGLQVEIAVLNQQLRIVKRRYRARHRQPLKDPRELRGGGMGVG